MFEKFINKMNKEREFLVKGGFLLFSFMGIVNVIARLFYVPPLIKEFYITREYVIAFMMMYFLNEWAKLQDSNNSRKVE